MSDIEQPDQLSILRNYADGRLGTKDAITQLGMHDYADLLIALGKQDLRQPKPPATPAHEAQVALAAAILQPRLLNGR